MKDNNKHTVKKCYIKPLIEEVMIDVAISLDSPSPGEGEHEEMSLHNNFQPTSAQPDYGSKTYTPSNENSPFGSNSPNYK